MNEQLWYKNAVIYSLDLETFMDGNGDGTGDFKGLCDRLDYLHAMGVDTVWLAPFQPTPNKDNGYDIADYYGVDERHGSSGDFVDFIYKAKQLGIKVIMDLVVNHTSDLHPWFIEARSGKDSPRRDWYIWSDRKPEHWDQGMVFPGVQKRTWTFDKQSRSYYFHRFFEFMPDLNTDNPAVREEICKIVGYWLQLGVAGFRVDAVPFILESPVTTGRKPRLNYRYLYELRRFLQWRSGDAVLLGEANVLPKDSMSYFGPQGEGLHMMFNFFVNQYLFYALASSDATLLIKALDATRKIPGQAQWAYFLRNHDELDLGRLREKERKLVMDRFGPEANMQLYFRGLRRRLASMLGNRKQIELAYSLMFSMPGTPVIRYGDEIGMGEDLSLKERDSVRTPMQWSGEYQAGFSTARKLVHPVISEGFYSYNHINVEQQRREPSSLLNWMTSMIRLRKECPEIGFGDWEILDTGSKEVLGMRYTWRNRSLYIWHNFRETALELTVRAKTIGSERLIDLLNNIESTADEKGRHTINLEAFGYRWFRDNRRQR